MFTSALAALAFGRSVPESLRGAPSVTAVESLADIRLATRKGHDEAFAEALGALYEAPLPGAGDGHALLRRSGRDALALLRRIEDVRGADDIADRYPGPSVERLSTGGTSGSGPIDLVPAFSAQVVHRPSDLVVVACWRAG